MYNLAGKLYLSLEVQSLTWQKKGSKRKIYCKKKHWNKHDIWKRMAKTRKTVLVV